MMMDKDIFDFSFDEITSMSDIEDCREERLIEIKRYERIYLLKPQIESGFSSNDIDDDKLLDLYQNIEFNGFKRNYVENLLERDYTLEGCTPYQLTIGDTVIEDGSWGNLLCKFSAYLLDTFPNKLETIGEFRAPWTKAVIFSSTPKTNYKPIGFGLFLNCNHTALHSCWLIQDLLDYFDIDKSTIKLLIHRPNSVENAELKKHLETLFVLGFKNYIKAVSSKDDEYAEKVINNIRKYINPVLCSLSKSYQNIFLFDDLTVTSSYIGKMKNTIKQSLKYDEKAKKVLCMYLTLLLNYYKM